VQAEDRIPVARFSNADRESVQRQLALRDRDWRHGIVLGPEEVRGPALPYL
jgi:hypothetical protein